MDVNADNDILLRGPLLAAHRALRKAVSGRSAEMKGQCAAIAWERRQAGVSAPPGDEMLRPLILSQTLSGALTQFGGPGLIPEHSGFFAYVRRQQQKVKIACTVATSDFNIIQEAYAPAEGNAPAPAVTRMSVLKAQVTAEGWAEFSRLFEESFGELLALASQNTE